MCRLISQLDTTFDERGELISKLVLNLGDLLFVTLLHLEDMCLGIKMRRTWIGLLIKTGQT
jgi:hypothetical protein